MSDGRRAFEAWLAEPSTLTPEQAQVVEGLERDLAEHLSEKPRRLKHSLMVGRTAEALARHYGQDPFEARVAGVLHDWEKAASNAETVAKAEELGIDLGVPLEDVSGLLHGLVAERTLKDRYPWLSAEVLQAIGRHTLGAPDMAPLDMVLFVADGLEPTRPPVPALERQRDRVGEDPLDRLFLDSFLDGVAYVVDTRRYLHPGTLDVYNELVRREPPQQERKAR